MSWLVVEPVEPASHATDRAAQVLRPRERLTLRIGGHAQKDRHLVADQLGDVLGLPCKMPTHQPVSRQLGVVGHDRHLVDPLRHLLQEAARCPGRVSHPPQQRTGELLGAVHQLQLLQRH